MTQNLSVPNRPRVVVSDLPRPRELRPSHFTPDTFTGAPKPVQDDDKQRLGQALAAFGASLSGLASVAAARAMGLRARLAPALLDQGIPSSVEETLKLAYQGSPMFHAALENVRAAQAQASGRKSNFHPRVDLRASKAIGHNQNGVAGKRDEEVIELVLNYNLFKGGADHALVRQFSEKLEQAKDLRDKACRDDTRPLLRCSPRLLI